MNTKEKLMQLLELCIENNFNFDLSTTNTITVCWLDETKDKFQFYKRTIITEESLDELIEELNFIIKS